MRITVLGGGSWGTTLAIHLQKNGHDIVLWEFDENQSRRIDSDRVNETFLPGISIPDAIEITSNIIDSVREAQSIVFAVPSHFMRSTANSIQSSWNTSGEVSVVVSVSKGLEADSLKRMEEVLTEELDGLSEESVCVLSGPSHAEEVSREVPTAIVAASKSEKTAKIVQDIFFSSTFRVYTSDDPTGVELSGALKNTIAIAAGICDGVGFGDNTKAALITRGLVEMTRMGVALGAKEETYSGLAGMGDLIVTCLSKHSRNRYVGEKIGKGETLDEVLAGMTMVAEGVRTTRAIKKLSEKLDIEMPISDQIYAVLFEGKSPHQAMVDLMSREPKNENR